MINMLAVSGSIKQAHIDLSNNSKGILSLEDRNRIWITMDDPDDSEASYLNRTHLKVLCVNQMKPIWTRVFPTNPGVDRMLQLTHSLMEKSVNRGRRGRGILFPSGLDSRCRVERVH